MIADVSSLMSMLQVFLPDFREHDLPCIELHSMPEDSLVQFSSLSHFGEQASPSKLRNSW